jgi:hypothetical protein
MSPGREISILIAIKLALVVLLWWAFFSPEHRTAVDPTLATDRMFSGPDAGPRER